MLLNLKQLYNLFGESGSVLLGISTHIQFGDAVAREYGVGYYMITHL